MTKPIADGYHTITPHLVVNDGAAAIKFYKKAFGAEELRRHPGPDGSVMHAALRIGNSIFMLNDEFPDMGVVGPKALNGTPVTIHLSVEKVDDWFKRAVEAGADAAMPPADMFWGDRYAMVVDPYGHRWSMATHIEDLSPEEIARRGQEAMASGHCAEEGAAAST